MKTSGELIDIATEYWEHLKNADLSRGEIKMILGIIEQHLWLTDAKEFVLNQFLISRVENTNLKK